MFLGLTLLSTLELLSMPWVATRRARRIRYLISTERLIILRQGLEWSIVGLRAAIVLCISSLCAFGVLGLIIYLVTTFVEYIRTDGFGATLLWALITSIFVVPVIFSFGLIGSLGLAFQTFAIAEARKDREALHFRRLPLRDFPEHRPSVVRLRDNGAAGVLLGVESFWDNGSDSPNSGFYAAVDVGSSTYPTLRTWRTESGWLKNLRPLPNAKIEHSIDVTDLQSEANMPSEQTEVIRRLQRRYRFWPCQSRISIRRRARPCLQSTLGNP